MQEKSICELLLKNGLENTELQKDGKKLGSLKLLILFVEYVLKIENANKLISPLFVLNDLRQLHGHLSETSFNERYKKCKERLDIPNNSTDLEVYKKLITKLILLYESLFNNSET